MLKFSRGFALIELMVGVVILAIVLSIAVPSLSQWGENTRIRTTAEAIQSGLALARTEALKRNTTMRFQLTNTLDGGCSLSTSGPHWVVSRESAEGACDASSSAEMNDSPWIVQIYDGAQGGEGRTTISAGQSLFTFNSLGRLTSSAANISVWDAEGEANCVSKGGKARCLQIEVTSGGGIRMCDPVLSSTDTQACE
jgi:type IV fimbrial biogenesis protein FimT